MKNYLYLLFLLAPVLFYAQKNEMPYTFGSISQQEIKMTDYTPDSTANAVVLYAHGNTVVSQDHIEVFLNSTFYKKIKILRKDGLSHASVSIPLYIGENKDEERVKNLKAVTYNENEPPTVLSANAIFTTKVNDHWKEITFTFPNVKPGSVIEYQYSLESVFFFNFTGWSFQSEIPTVYSEFHALIPGNWRYNRNFTGTLPLDINEAGIKKKCFSLHVGTPADCEEVTYAMRNIPAFVEEEKFSTTKSNYLSRIKFELAEIYRTDGSSVKYTSTWEETDRKLKQEESIGKQLHNNAFYVKNLPPEMLKIASPVEKAKTIYSYIQNHFSLNTDEKSIYSNVDSKNAFKDGFGSAAEINIALINALQAADIPAEIMLVSTRNNGFPTKIHPVMTDFNYLAAHVRLHDKSYFLDASDKYLTFGMLPFKVLNGGGRVMDFNKGSYWIDITPQELSSKRQIVSVKLNEENILEGKMKELNNGYFGKLKRESLKSNPEAYISSMHDSNENLEILSYKNENIDALEEPLAEEFELKIIAADVVGDYVYLYPFVEKLIQNPFQLNQRNYPVDFGFKSNESFFIDIELPENYKVISVPENVALSLPNDGGYFTANYTVTGDKISVVTKINFKKTIYYPQEYPYLKELYHRIIKTHNSLITLEKI